MTRAAPRDSLPHDLELERAVLGCYLLEAPQLDDVPLTSSDFYAPAHREIFAALAALRAEGDPIDIRTLSARLKRDGSLDRIGGIAYLARLEVDLPDTSRLPTYARELEKLRIRREIIENAADATQKATKGKDLFALVPVGARIADLAARASRKRSGDHLAQSLDSIAPEPIRWLWKPRLALGKLSILEGDPGGGKSFIGAAIAAALSRGCGLPGLESSEPCSSLLFSLEDGAGDTLRPRIEGMGADLSRVHVVDCQKGAGLSLDEAGAARIEAEIERTGAGFVFVDPVTALLPAKVDLFKDNHVREALGRLVQIAARQGCSICIVRHLNKGGSGKAAYRGSGSVAFTALARTVLLAGRTPDGLRSGMVLHKSNIGPTQAAALEFEIDASGRFAWKHGESDLTAADLLAEPAPSPVPECPGAIDEAADFLLSALAEGPRPSAEILKGAAGLGVARRTLWRAKKKVGAEAYKPHGAGSSAWFWRLDPPAIALAAYCRPRE